MFKHLSEQDQATEFLLYTAPNGAIKVEVLLSNESIWLTQERSHAPAWECIRKQEGSEMVSVTNQLWDLNNG